MAVCALPCPGTPLDPGARVGHLAIVEAGPEKRNGAGEDALRD
jgi:hypothetical protein